MSQPTPLEAGQKAPAFSFTFYGKPVSSDSMDGPCLLYFYPKDDTPGCTKQACGLRNAWTSFKKAGIQVVGVSKDGEDSHQKFRKKYSLPFALIADTDLKLAKAYGVLGKKEFMGKTYNSVHRMSFLIDANGTILKTYPTVKPAEHAETVLADYTQLTS